MGDTEMMYKLVEGEGQILAVAIHNGHELREEVADIMALDDASRFREEDPYTGTWASIVSSRIVAYRSRFEVDLNRPRDKAVYLNPADAWGLNVWKEQPSPGVIAGSLTRYDGFYAQLHRLCSRMEKEHSHFIVFDLHSYNHRRQGSDGPPADQDGNPEINIGTGTMNRELWASLVDRFIEELRAFDFLGRHLDVRENVKFYGGQLPRYIHEHFPNSGCALAIEVKKFFMDEWSGTVDGVQLKEIRQALRETIPVILDELKKK
jgi:N-formylglutamate amidohydrolase